MKFETKKFEIGNKESKIVITLFLHSELHPFISSSFIYTKNLIIGKIAPVLF